MAAMDQKRTRTPLRIAEVKTQSPFGWKSDKTWDELFAIADKKGDWISVHTDPRWGGSFDLVRRARLKTFKPILAKGIHATDSDVDRALSAGADLVLVVGRLPPHRRVLVEPTTLDGLRTLPEGYRAVWNARDLTTGEPKPYTFQDAREVWKGWLCQASFIRSWDDVDPTADAILVGEHLAEFVV